MPNQPDIKTRIAEILRAHSTTVVQYRDTDAAGCCVRCKCGVPATHHELHVTNKLVSELGLIPESAETYFGDHQCVNVSRYVTGWVPDVS